MSVEARLACHGLVGATNRHGPDGSLTGTVTYSCCWSRLPDGHGSDGSETLGHGLPALAGVL